MITHSSLITGLRVLAVSLCFLSGLSANATQLDFPGPAGSSYLYGNNLTVLPNGNLVVIDQEWSPTSNPGQRFGAAYLINGADFSIISTLQGSTTGTAFGDIVGSGGITVLTNGNFVIGSPAWNDGRGAATWGSATTGFSATPGATVVIDSTNSLVGSFSTTNNTGESVGIAVNALPNGNYFVSTPRWNNFKGAVTWGNGTTGITGVVDGSNSLVGSTGTTSTDGDSVGSTNGTQTNVVVLKNGNYVVPVPKWDNGSLTNVGAATWCDGSTGRTGTISASNSLVGTNASDAVGTSVVALTNGNYVVRSTAWKNGSLASAGAATWASGTSGITGTISSSNSLVGGTASDQVGTFVVALTNGNYVVASPNWDGPVVDAGAVTWCDGSTGRTGSVTTANSLHGTTLSDKVGSTSLVALTNGNYVVGSNVWNNGSILKAGAATWGNGTTGITGPVTTSNSLYGTSTNDGVASNFSVALKNSNYVVRSSNWNNGAATTAGAATWGNGTTGITGPVSTSNSIYGTTAADNVGLNVLALTNGNFVTYTAKWHNGAIANAGAATWGNGSTGTTGAVSASNSLVGSTANDGVPSTVAALTNGNYVLGSRFWDNGATTDVGAVTWGNGNTGVTGTIGAANSLIGTTTGDQFGSTAATPLPNGDFLAFMFSWTNPAISLPIAAALCYCDGRAGQTTGTISETFSVFGTSTFNGFGGVRSFVWDPVRNRAVVNRVDNKMLSTLTLPIVDYTVTTTGGTIVCTDVSGSSDTLTVINDNPSGVGGGIGNIKFSAPNRVFSVNGGPGIVGDSGIISRVGINSITINAGDGDDVINIGTGAPSPSGFAGLCNFTINGGKGNDTVNLIGPINMAVAANLDVDLQNDDPTPGSDVINLATTAHITCAASGTGNVTLRASKTIDLGQTSEIIIEGGTITIEANQQLVPSTGDFSGVHMDTASLSTSSGAIVIKGRGGNAGAAAVSPNVGLDLVDTSFSGSSGGSLSMNGTSGTGGNSANGVWLKGCSIHIAGDVDIVGNAVGVTTGSQQCGVHIQSSLANGFPELSTTGTGHINITGTGAPADGGNNSGILIEAAGTAFTENGDITLTGFGGLAGSAAVGSANHGIELYGTLSVFGTGKVDLDGTGGTSSHFDNHGIFASAGSLAPGFANTFTNGGTVTLKGAGNGSTGYGLVLDSSGGSVIDTTTAGGDVVLIGDLMEFDDFGSSGELVVKADPFHSITFKPKTPGTAMLVGGGDVPPPGGDLGLSLADLSHCDAGTLIFGGSTAGDVTQAADLFFTNGNNIQYISGGDIYFDNGTLTTTGNVTVTPGAGKKMFVENPSMDADLTAPGYPGVFKLSSGSTLAIVASTTGYDTLAVTGKMNITGVTLAIQSVSYETYVPSQSQAFTVISNPVGGVTGTFNGLPEGATVSVLGVNKVITYTGGPSGNDVVLNPVATITNVTSAKNNGSYNAGILIPITVAFTTAVDVTGNPTLALNSGGSAVYDSGSGTDTITFNYTVAATQNSTDLDYSTTTSLALAGGTINTTSGSAAAILTLPTPGTAGSLGNNKAIVIDTTPPTILSINRQSPSGQTTALNTMTFRVTYSEPVTGMTNASFSVVPVNGSNIVGTVTGVSVVNPTTCDVNVSITSGTGEFRLRGVD